MIVLICLQTMTMIIADPRRSNRLSNLPLDVSFDNRNVVTIENIMLTIKTTIFNGPPFSKTKTQIIPTSPFHLLNSSTPAVCNYFKLLLIYQVTKKLLMLMNLTPLSTSILHYSEKLQKNLLQHMSQLPFNTIQLEFF